MDKSIIADKDQALAAVVGVFGTHQEATRVAAALAEAGLNLQRVSRRDPTVSSEMPDIFYDDITSITTQPVINGMLQGGAIGAGSGLLLLGVPGLNILAPIAGALAGIFIGGVAGIDEANRGIELPNQVDYQRMLAAGQSFVVISGDEATRIKYGNQLMELGALAIHQHPPVLEAIRTSVQSQVDESTATSH